MGGSFYHPWFHCRPQNDGFFWQNPMLTLLSANFHNSLQRKSPHYHWDRLKKRLRAQKTENKKKKNLTKRQCLVMKESATATTVWTLGCCFASFSSQTAITHPSHWKKCALSGCISKEGLSMVSVSSCQWCTRRHQHLEDVKKRTVLSPPVARIHSSTPPLSGASAPILAVGKIERNLVASRLSAWGLSSSNANPCNIATVRHKILMHNSALNLTFFWKRWVPSSEWNIKHY